MFPDVTSTLSHGVKDMTIRVIYVHICVSTCVPTEVSRKQKVIKTDFGNDYTSRNIRGYGNEYKDLGDCIKPINRGGSRVQLNIKG